MFTGTVTQANRPIEDADRILKTTLDIEKLDITNEDSLAEASTIIATAYITQYSSAIEKYIEAITNKHSLIEQGSDFLADMQREKVAAESNSSGFTYMPGNLVNFLNKHGIKYDRTGGDTKQNGKEWQVNIEYLNSWIKGRSNEVETDVIKLNDIINKQNQLLESTTTILKKTHDLLENITKSLV